MPFPLSLQSLNLILIKETAASIKANMLNGIKSRGGEPKKTIKIARKSATTEIAQSGAFGSLVVTGVIHTVNHNTFKRYM